MHGPEICSREINIVLMYKVLALGNHNNPLNGQEHINKQIQRHCAQKRTLVLCIDLILFYIIELSSSFA